MSDKLNELVDKLSNLTLLEVSQLTCLLREKWGITEYVVPLMRPADELVTTIGETSNEQYFFDVFLMDYGPRKIDVIKVVRMLTNLGLSEAKQLVEGLGSILVDVSKEVAESAKKQLEEAGAKVKLV